MFEVCEEKCSQCLFSPDRVVDAERMKSILANCQKRDIHFVCHKASIAGKDMCCRGFYDTQTAQSIRFAQRLGIVAFVPVPEGDAA